jgi:hypothetical protein
VDEDMEDGRRRIEENIDEEGEDARRMDRGGDEEHKEIG